MPADLENDMNELGARLLAEAPPVTTDEVLRYTAERRSPTTTIDPLITDAPLIDITDITSVRRPRRRSVLVASVAAASVFTVGLGIASRDDDAAPTAVGTSPASTTAGTAAASAPTTGGVDPTTTTATNLSSGNSVSWPPRVLIDDSWDLVDANERSFNEGYMTFTRDGLSVFVGWFRGQLSGDEWYEDKGYIEAGAASMLGQSVTVYASPPLFATSDIRQLIENGQLESDLIASELDSLESSLASVPEGEADFGDFIGGPLLEAELAEAIDAGLIEGVSDSLEARVVWDSTSLNVQIRPLESGAEPALEDLVAVLEAFHQVETSEWEAALPDNIVTFSERSAVIGEMTAGVPLPKNFAVDFLGDQELVQSRGAIADEVVKSVACAWLNQYFTATAGNNPDAAQTALDAIGSIPDWPVSQELNAAYESATPESGVIGIPNSGLLSLTVNADGTITNEGTGDVLTNDFAVDLCYVEAVG